MNFLLLTPAEFLYLPAHCAPGRREEEDQNEAEAGQLWTRNPGRSRFTNLEDKPWLTLLDSLSVPPEELNGRPRIVTGITHLNTLKRYGL